MIGLSDTQRKKKHPPHQKNKRHEGELQTGIQTRRKRKNQIFGKICAKLLKILERAGKVDRREEMAEIFQNLDPEKLKLVTPLIDQIIFLENQINYLMTLPFIVVKEGEPKKQRATPAYRQYKELSQTYINALKVVNGALGIKSDKVETPLRKYMEKKVKEDGRLLSDTVPGSNTERGNSGGTGNDRRIGPSD